MPAGISHIKEIISSLEHDFATSTVDWDANSRCRHELHLRRRLTLLELERRTLSESSMESAARLGSHFRGISAYW